VAAAFLASCLKAEETAFLGRFQPQALGAAASVIILKLQRPLAKNPAAPNREDAAVLFLIMD
ncbi:hypothetical protein, partial [Methylicorpusculum sp.]|uniref:hypothetical protein n=1 Tax=Methylicorpusculum sp. TaxID=2713644 RepID=UPI002ABBC996